MIVVSLAASSFASASTAQQVNDAYSGLPMTYTGDAKGAVAAQWMNDAYPGLPMTYTGDAKGTVAAQWMNDAYSGLPMTYTRDEKGMVIPRCPIHGLCGNPWATENGFNQ